MTLTRRRFLSISAAAAALPSASFAGQSARWRGVALGAPASMVLAGVPPLAARPVFAALEAELERLERIFSLYRPDSALVRLNAGGRLDAPPPEMLDLLSLAGAIHDATGGAFDPTVQPLWQARAAGGDEAAARARVGWQSVRFDARSVRFARPGMALTLNGIAQGYITDRIAELLAARGFDDVLVDIGEVAARGHRSDGAPWRAGIADPGGRIVARVTLRDRALATSAPMGTVLPGGQGHILDPSGRAPRRALMSVSAPRAAVADGLSTALCLVDDAAGARALARFAGARIEAAT
jgi:thiamine biosynthesis lipoprotein